MLSPSVAISLAKSGVHVLARLTTSASVASSAPNGHPLRRNML